ncbi:MAG: hypothetical protein Ta2B_09570 [Termitinemataceae bacterium]|nr:MAG: hypothetical protein Ta2B_09570 [Termitinemataceae bacterium]
MKNKRIFLGFASVLALALVFGACNNGDFEYTSAYPTSKGKLTIKLSSGKTWESTWTYYYYSSTLIATVTEVAKGKYIKVDKEFQFYTDSDSTIALAEVYASTDGGSSYSEVTDPDDLADFREFFQIKKGELAFTGVKKGKTLIINSYYALTKASVDGEYVEVEIIGEIED